ncbi:MAG: AAA family ATPase [Pseudomonadota bacterium]
MRYCFDEIVVDAASRSLTRAGKNLRVEPKVFDVLVYLIEQRDRMVTREELQEKCWNGLFVSSGTLSRCLSRVRSTVGQDRNQNAPIQTMHRKGYRFAGDVELHPSAADLQAETAVAIPKVSTPAPASPGGDLVAERRPVTMVDLQVTPASDRLRTDPEAAYAVLQRYAQIMQATASRFGGDLIDGGNGKLSIRLGLKGLGEQAGHAGALAAFDLLSTARQLELDARIVITTQVAIVETLEARTKVVFNLGFDHLQLRVADAEPNTIIADAETAKQLRSIGIVARAVSDDEVLFRVEPLEAPEGLTDGAAFFGRYRELEHLAQYWRLVPRQGGRVVMVEGDPGVGKTRLVEEFIERCELEDAAVMQLRCSPYYQHTPFFPFMVTLRDRLRITPKTPALRQLAAIEEVIADLDGAEGMELPLLASLLALDPMQSEARPLRLPERRQRAQTEAAMTQLVRATAKDAPLLLWVEDVQWSDPSTLATLASLAEATAETKILLLVTRRPSDDDPFPVEDAARLALQPFSMAETLRLLNVEAEREGGFLPARSVEEIAKRSGGIPLFITEFLSMARSDDGDRTDLPVPTTLQSVLLARLDQAGTAKQVAQWASVCGQEFDPALLQSAMGTVSEEIGAALDRLVDLGLLDRLGETSEDRHRFRTDLLRETAYGSMLLKDRRERHRAVAAAMVAEFPKLAAQEPATVARHLDAASDPQAAAYYWGLAGRTTANLGAPKEASALLQQAREALDRVAEPTREMSDLSREIDDLLAGL